jgi:hypothetical protein
MSAWHSKNVGDGVEALAPSMQLHEAFAALASASTGGLPPGIGVFSRYDLGTNTVTWYFSPEASSLSKVFKAVPCEKPVPSEGFGLLVGDARSWEVHFAGYLARRRQEKL